MMSRRDIYRQIFFLVISEGILMFVLPIFPYLFLTGAAYEIGSDVCYGASLLLPPLLLTLSGEPLLPPSPGRRAKGGALIAFLAIGTIIAFSYVNYYLIYPLVERGIIVGTSDAIVLDSPLGIIGTLLSVVVIPAVCEEFFFRGALLRRLAPLGNGFAVFVSALFFSMFHANVAQFIYAFAAGAVLGYCALATDSLILPMALHGINNSISVLLVVVNRYSGAPTAATVSVIADTLFCIIAVVAFAVIAVKRTEDRSFCKLEAPENIPEKDPGGFFPPFAIYFLLVAYETAMVNLPAFR